MLLFSLDRRLATAIRAVGLALVVYSVAHSAHPPSGHGRGLVVLVALVLAAGSAIVWIVQTSRDRASFALLVVLALAGGVLTPASPTSAASAFLFVAAITAAVRFGMRGAAWVAASGALALAVSTILYRGAAVGTLAYVLGIAVAVLAAANARGSAVRAEQAELLLAQTQRSHEEQLRVARLEESTRIAREIHDVLAHALAGLTIQLEASAALLEQGADRAEVLTRVRRAHELARQGLQETRRAVGALRGEPPAAAPAVMAALGRLADEYRDDAGAPADLRLDGDGERLTGPSAQTVIRIVQEALTNVRRHARGAAVTISLHVDGDVELVVANGPGISAASPGGGGFGIRGMRERAELLGGTLEAEPDGEGWRVRLKLPAVAVGEPVA